MDWKELADDFSAAHDPLVLAGRKEHLADGIVVSHKSVPQLRAFAFSDPRFVQQSELTYVRGRDLFSSFQADHVTAECYWRLPQSDELDNTFRSSSGFQVEAIVSLRSSKLSVDRISFGMIAQNVAQSAQPISNLGKSISTPGFAERDNTFSWCVLAHPDDENEVSLNQALDQVQIDIEVPWLERGVIRRIRVLFICWSSVPDAQQLIDASQQFASSELPLTT